MAVKLAVRMTVQELFELKPSLERDILAMCDPGLVEDIEIVVTLTPTGLNTL
jgi:hypothetical protein